MKKISYFVILIISIFIYNSMVSAQSIIGNGEWQDIAMKPFTLGSSNWSAYCSVVDAKSGAPISSVQAKPVKNSDGSYKCMVKTTTSGNYTVTWGEKTDDGVVGQTTIGSSSIDVAITINDGDDPNTPPQPKEIDTDSSEFYEICSAEKNPQLLATFKLIGIFVTIVKILVPIILIVMGSIDMSKAVISNNNDAIQKNLIVFGKRTIAGVAVFLAPSIIFGIFRMVDGMADFDGEYETCVACLLGTSSCPDVHFVSGN